MNTEKASKKINSLALDQAKALVDYRRSKLVLAEARAELIREGLETGELTVRDVVVSCW
jgi:hypothetical protein